MSIILKETLGQINNFWQNFLSLHITYQRLSITQEPRLCEGKNSLFVYILPTPERNFLNVSSNVLAPLAVNILS